MTPEIRVANLSKLIDGYKQEGIESYAEIARRHDGVDASYLSQLMTGKRSFGERAARKLERLLGLTPFYFDKAVDFVENPKNINIIHSISMGSSDLSDTVLLPVYDAKTACGLVGVVNDHNPEVVGYFEITQNYLCDRGLSKNGDGLVVSTASGSSMFPTIPENTQIVIDTNQRDYSSFVNGKIYVFAVGNEMICKRAYKRLDGTLVLSSDNPDKEAYPDLILDKESFNQVQIFGRVRVAVVDL